MRLGFIILFSLDLLALAESSLYVASKARGINMAYSNHVPLSIVLYAPM